MNMDPKQGAEPDEIRALLNSHHQDAMHWALACCHWNRDEAEDVLHTAYERVLNGKARFNGQSTFRTWLFGVIRNCANESLRRLKRWVLNPANRTPDVSDHPDAELATRQAARLVRQSLWQLSARQRECLTLVFYCDMTIAQAAAVMQLPVGTARTHYARGKQKLARLLKGYADG
ncbi:MAG: sigma-70 family RNA polymerase sigma factor [Pseudomonadota bacterium]|nr:MAG: sigma-70 family RNA polymerase sigma factor [Pseudomonadota bacterium]QKK03914.1 MAG: sigma-70 family RNA polymerase sigma factor [Pseudomonadota bacterium]